MGQITSLVHRGLCFLQYLTFVLTKARAWVNVSFVKFLCSQVTFLHGKEQQVSIYDIIWIGKKSFKEGVRRSIPWVLDRSSAFHLAFCSGAWFSWVHPSVLLRIWVLLCLLWLNSRGIPQLDLISSRWTVVFVLSSALLCTLPILKIIIPIKIL